MIIIQFVVGIRPVVGIFDIFITVINKVIIQSYFRCENMNFINIDIKSSNSLIYFHVSK